MLLSSSLNFCYANYNKLAQASAPFPSEASWKYELAKTHFFSLITFLNLFHAAAEIAA